MKWTPEKIKIAKDILSRSVLIESAIVRIMAKAGGVVTKESLRRAFRRAGEKSPNRLLGRKLDPTPITAYSTSERVPGVLVELGFSSEKPKTGYVAGKIRDAENNAKLKATAVNFYGEPKAGPLSWTKEQVDVFNSANVSTMKETSNEFFIDVVTNNFKNDLRRNSVLLHEVKSGKRKIQIVRSVEKKTTRILVISDLHVPYHDVAAWNCVLQVIRETSPETVVIIGDFADMYSISSHPKSLDRKMNFATERDAVNAALDELRLAAGNSCRLIWTEGNHEDRITRFLQSSAPELAGINEIRAEGLFKVKERNIEWVPYRSEIKVGNCSFTHDVGRCGVNTARQSLLDFGGNLVVGHSHRGACVYQGEIKGSSHFCLNVGWHGDVNAIDYIHRARAKRDWQLGFGLVDQDETGYSWATFVPVLNGQCIVDGKVISGQKAAA